MDIVNARREARSGPRIRIGNRYSRSQNGGYLYSAAGPLSITDAAGDAGRICAAVDALAASRPWRSPAAVLALRVRSRYVEALPLAPGRRDAGRDQSATSNALPLAAARHRAGGLAGYRPAAVLALAGINRPCRGPRRGPHLAGGRPDAGRVRSRHVEARGARGRALGSRMAHDRSAGGRRSPSGRSANRRQVIPASRLRTCRFLWRGCSQE
jgi:hypothetical protein